MASLSLRMQVRHWRALTWAATSVLVVVAGWNLWQIVQKTLNKKYEWRPMSHFEQVIGSATGSIDEVSVRPPNFERDYSRLVRTPINGYVPAPPPKIEEGPKDDTPPPPKPISDVLMVTAVTSAPDNKGRVVVKYKDDSIKLVSKDESVLKVGARLAGDYAGEPFNGVLKGINADSAVFGWCGKDVVVHPDRRGEGDDKPKSATPAAAGGKLDLSLSDAEKKALKDQADKDKTVKYAPDGYILGKKDLEEWSVKTDDLMQQARITERKDANGKKEVVVGQIRPGSPLAKTYDIQSEDVIISINGTPVTSRTQGIQYLRENDHLSKYVVVGRRKGKDFTRTFLVNRD